MTVTLPSTLEGRDFGGALLAARAQEVEEVMRAMTANRAAVITGEHDVGKTRMVSQASAVLTLQDNVRVATIDLRRTAGDTRLAWRWMRALAAAVAGPVAFSHIAAMAPSMWPGSTRAAEVAVRRLLGWRTDWALAERPTELTPDEARDALDHARDATLASAHEAPTVLIFDHFEAPLDAPRAPFDAGRLLWGLRPGSAPAGLHVTVICHPSVIDLVAGPDAALLGAPSITVNRPSLDTWRAALDGDERLLAVVDDVVARTRGHIPSTVLLLHTLRSGATRSAGDAFDALALTQHQHTERCLRHAATLHRLGAQVLEVVARGEKPYQATPEARSSRDIANALTALWRTGLLTRPEKGRWEVGDPFVAHLLRGPR